MCLSAHIHINVCMAEVLLKGGKNQEYVIQDEEYWLAVDVGERSTHRTNSYISVLL